MRDMKIRERKIRNKYCNFHIVYREWSAHKHQARKINNIALKLNDVLLLEITEINCFKGIQGLSREFFQANGGRSPNLLTDSLA